MDEVNTSGYWTAIPQLERLTVKWWREKKRPSIDLETALANDLKMLQTRVDRYPEGNVWVTISCITRLQAWHHEEVFVLQKNEFGDYEVERIV